MSDWALAVSVLAATAAVGFFGQAIVRQLLDRIESEARRTEAHVDRRFLEAEERRQESQSVWAERLSVRDQRIGELAERMAAAHAEHPPLEAHIVALERRVDDTRNEMASRYVSRETYLEAEGRTMIKLDKILERLNTLDPEHG